MVARDIDELISRMTIEQKASITTGATLWTTHGVPEHGIPSVTVTDGPAGARGPFTPGIGGQVATLCVPCGTALGASFDTELLEEIGRALGHQTRTKNARVLLAPTVNLHRSPLFGRAFECYSEDPVLSGRLAAAFIRGVQSQGVATTVKHFVGNDAEFERMTIDSVIDDRTLREVYMLPFEYAVREGGSLGIMTSYNRMNGTYCAENRWLLQQVLRDEWGFEGLVVTDWFAGTTTEGAARAGLDLEMPAPPRAYGPVLAQAVRDGRVDEHDLNRATRTLLSVFDRLGALDDEPIEPIAVDLPEHRALARRAATSGIVLLRNEPVVDRRGAVGAPLLPLAVGGAKSIAVIGPNAERARIMGGGSAEVLPHHRTPIIEALRQRVGAKVAVRHEAGGSIEKTTPIVDANVVRTPRGEPGFEVVVHDGPPGSDHELVRLNRPDGRIMVVGRQDEGVPKSAFHFRATGLVRVETSGQYVVSLVEVSPCRLFVDGECVVDGATTLPPRGHAFFGMGSVEISAIVELDAGRDHEIVLECDGAQRQWMHGARVGLQYIEPDDPIRRAVDLAAESDLAIVVVGTTDEWESEGHDRDTLELPGRQAELIREVAAANPRTVVLVNTGAPVEMSWADAVPAVLQVWFGGQEMGDAVLDVLFGDADPGGRLPTTIPERIEHTPAFGNFPGEHGRVRYGEGLLIGHRWYEARSLPVRYPFGHGLSYTTFEVGTPDIERDIVDFSSDPDARVTVRVEIRNSGARPGSHVVQLYVSPLQSSVQRPLQELKAFRKVHLASGASTIVEFTLGMRAFAHWDPGDSYRSSLQPQVTGERTVVDTSSTGRWKVEAGLHEIRVGNSSADIVATAYVTIQNESLHAPDSGGL